MSSFLGMAQNSCLDCSADSLDVLLKKPASGQERVDILVVAIASAASWEDIHGYLLELETYTAVWNAPNFEKFHILKKATSAYKSGDLNATLLYAIQYIEERDKEGAIMGPNSPLGLVRTLFRKTNGYEEMLTFYQDKLEQYRKNGPQENMGICYHGIAGYFFYRGNYNTAIGYYLRAAEQYKGHNYSYGDELAVIGYAFETWGNYDKGLDYSARSIEYLEKAKGYKIICFSLTTMARIYKKQKRFEKALASSEEALLLIDKANLNGQWTVNTLIEISKTHLAMGQPEQALIYVQKAQVLGEKLNFVHGREYRIL